VDGCFDETHYCLNLVLLLGGGGWCGSSRREVETRWFLWFKRRFDEDKGYSVSALIS
jgi:hypothetical protein